MPIDPISQPPFPAPAQPAAPARPPGGGADFAAALSRADAAPAVPEAPPSEALRAVQEAGQVYARLRAVDRELRFEHTPHGVRIEVYDGDGRLVQRVPATDVLRLAGGEQTWLA